ncbi:MAG: cobyrinate a,c-diamide synthase [Deferribacteres bacterium]|nr:cobyrinate a,c-diamide synthase [Deferribacteres bacterium]
MQGVVIAGTHSGCGKTTVTLGVLAALAKKGFSVQPFKAGPDFIDTGLHGLITGRPSRNLDLWMCGREYVAECFRRNSAGADTAVVEGVMGLYDGDLSTAELAGALGLPVVLVVDAFGMAESAGAVVSGFASLARPPGISGVIFNRIASERHYERVRGSVRDVPVLGYLPKNPGVEIPHRHLGLVVAEERPFSPEDVDELADAVLGHIDLDAMFNLPPAPSRRERGELTEEGPSIPSPLTGEGQGGGTPAPKARIAVARDRAFCFYYEDNLDLLRQAGAEIISFSPMSDTAVPTGVDALYIGGGYPELYAKELSGNKSMVESVADFAGRGMAVYAECGGFMYLTQGIYEPDGAFYPMAGVFPFKTKMTRRRARLGYREAVLKEDCIPGRKGAVIRGHEFHYSTIINSADAPVSGLARSYSVRDGSGRYIHDEGYRIKNTLGSYIHIHFGSNPGIAENFIGFVN